MPHPASRAAALIAALLLGACRPLLPPNATPPGPPSPASPAHFTLLHLPGAEGVLLQVLHRPHLAEPLRQRIIVLPGSGCAGMGAFATRYFAGLLHSEVLVLHKPTVAAHERTAAHACSNAFVQSDTLDSWQTHAQTALRAWAQQERPPRPTWLVGISEGAELLPALAPWVPQLAGLVLLASSGLDPREAAHLQAQHLGQEPAWQALQHAQAGNAPDHTVLQGRSLRYWRTLWHWPLAQPLIDGPWPLLQVWGEADALLPPAAYTRFAARAQGRPAPYCAQRLPGADHGLQNGAQDGVQQVWAWLERSAREGGLSAVCPTLANHR